jgi:VanZ family protein
MNNTIKLSKYYFAIPAVLMTIAISVVSSIEQPQLPDLGITFVDKIAHASVFFIYGLTLQILFNGCFPSFGLKKAGLWVIVSGFLFGICDELHQYFVPGRDCAVNDWLADAAGILLSLIFLMKVRKKIIRLKS